MQQHVQQEQHSKASERITTLSKNPAVCDLARNDTIQTCNELRNADAATVREREREKEERRKTQEETKKNAERDD